MIWPDGDYGSNIFSDYDFFGPNKWMSCLCRAVGGSWIFLYFFRVIILSGANMYYSNEESEKEKNCYFYRFGSIDFAFQIMIIMMTDDEMNGFSASIEFNFNDHCHDYSTISILHDREIQYNGTSVTDDIVWGNDLSSITEVSLALWNENEKPVNERKNSNRVEFYLSTGSGFIFHRFLQIFYRMNKFALHSYQRIWIIYFLHRKMEKSDKNMRILYPDIKTFHSPGHFDSWCVWLRKSNNKNPLLDESINLKKGSISVTGILSCENK